MHVFCTLKVMFYASEFIIYNSHKKKHLTNLLQMSKVLYTVLENLHDRLLFNIQFEINKIWKTANKIKNSI